MPTVPDYGVNSDMEDYAPSTRTLVVYEQTAGTSGGRMIALNPSNAAGIPIPAFRAVPTTPTVGSLVGEAVLNTTNGLSYIWDGLTWKSIVPPSIVSYPTDAAVLADTAPPAGTYATSLATGNLFIRYNTTGGTAWRQVGIMTYPTQAGLLTETPPDGAQAFAIDTGLMFIRAGGAWIPSGVHTDTEANLRTPTTFPNGTIAVSSDTQKLFVSDGTNFVGHPIREYATEVLMLADTPADGVLAVALDTGHVAFRTGGAWASINTANAIPTGNTDPTATGRVLGEMFFNTTDGVKVWDGTAWAKAIKASSAHMIGDIKQSWLTESQFNSQLPASEQGDWVLADGRTAAGTAFKTVTGLANVPDLRGGYLRPAGQNGNASAQWNGGTHRGYQDGLTKRPNTAFTGTTNAAGNHRHSYRVDGYGATSGGKEMEFIGHNVAHTKYTNDAGNHSHTVTINGGGDAETRPSSYSVNTFIKIN